MFDFASYPARGKYLISGPLQRNFADRCFREMNCNFYDIILFISIILKI